VQNIHDDWDAHWTDYAESAAKNPSQEYRRRLYRFIFRRDPARSGGSILPQPYEHIAAPARQTRLPVVQRWALVLGLVIVAYLVASHLVWRSVTQDLRAIHADIRKAIAESLQGEP